MGQPLASEGARTPVHAVCSNFLRARMLGAGGAGAGVTEGALERANARQDGHGERVRMRSPPRCMQDVSKFFMSALLYQGCHLWKKELSHTALAKNLRFELSHNTGGD